jgi:hypothetical protein
MDAQALPRLLDELAWTLRRWGASVAPSNVLDLARAFAVLGFSDRDALVACTVALASRSAAEARKVERVFGAFFASAGASADVFARLRDAGFSDEEVSVLRSLVDVAMEAIPAGGHEAGALAALLERGSHLDALMHGVTARRLFRRLHSPLQVGFYTHRLIRELGLEAARERVVRLRPALGMALGPRGDLLAGALDREVARLMDDLRGRVEALLPGSGADPPAEAAVQPEDIPWRSMGRLERDRVRRGLRRVAESLRGAERVRTRHARRGRLDPGRTMRALLRTGGVPFDPITRRRRRDKVRLVLLCDVSESVRDVSEFMLELVAAAHEVFDRTRSFVFVSEIVESTASFERGASRAADASYGHDLGAAANSNYGRALRAFEDRYASAVDRRTTVVVLGDGRSNYHEPGERSLARIGARARALYWLCPEQRSAWTTGDCAMARYEPHCTRVLEVATPRDLEAAARMLARVR